MFLYCVKFPKHFWPKEKCYKTYEQAKKVCENFNLEMKNIRIIYLEEDKNRITFD